METYIVRIYRREPGANCELAGMVEEPRCSHTKSFADIDELLSIFKEGSFTRQKEKQEDSLKTLRGGSK
jgi:hypothetical protein